MQIDYMEGFITYSYIMTLVSWYIKLYLSTSYGIYGRRKHYVTTKKYKHLCLGRTLIFNSVVKLIYDEVSTIVNQLLLCSTSVRDKKVVKKS